MILLFIVLLVLPNPRLRGHVRTREFFPAPTTQGPAAVRGADAGLRAGAGHHAVRARPAHLRARSSRSASSPCRSCPLVGLRRADLAVPAELRRHRRDRAWPTSAPAATRSGCVAAVVICALVGALVALPALRLSGIYLALATAAFAVLLDRWVFALPELQRRVRSHVNLFALGLARRRPAQGVRRTRSRRPSRRWCSWWSSSCSSSLLVVAIRRSRFGRRLLAMRDSEAACATLGLNLLGTRLAVFMLSAAIAGLGGALYATQLASIGPNNFDFVTGLPDLHAGGGRRRRLRRRRAVRRRRASTACCRC